MERLLRYGDVDEYNSPTYDGIDLLALGLWAMYPPTKGFADAASTMLPAIGKRISTLYHRRFGTSCGPYIRAYGLAPTEYVSLSGLLYSVCGEEPDTVLPSPITRDTVHVHDLYFLPLLQHVAPPSRHICGSPRSPTSGTTSSGSATRSPRVCFAATSPSVGRADVATRRHSTSTCRSPPTSPNPTAPRRRSA